MSFTSSSSYRSTTSCGSKFSYDHEGTVYCYCGMNAPLVTSNSGENLGRRFYGCNKYKDKGCKFFVWHDKPLDNEHVKNMMIQLRNENRDLQKENVRLKNETRVLSKVVHELSVKIQGLKKMSSVERYIDLADEVAVLKAKIEVVEAKLKSCQMEATKEARSKKDV
ncbi:hypothetical protein DITRI_Ditri06bG0057700 [Diplodiscus trichospermus]